ncbi:Synaptogyrin-1 [Lamellibrachia satsuma]|nr:Synaptogyrin-1 [Lamellibrachia satsuma]
MEGGGAYGAGKATGQFDYLVYIKKPQVILRAVSWLFAIIVFGCIRSQGYYEGSTCLYGDRNACNFGVAIGVLAFLGLMGFLILDALFDNISSVQHRKYVVIADMAFSGFWTFMWFVCFCYLTNKWNNTSVPTKNIDKVGRSGVQAAIAFSFFSIPTFAALTYLAIMNYRKGVTEEFAHECYDPNVMPSSQPIPSPYSAYPSTGETGDPYQQSPFGGQPSGGFQQGGSGGGSSGGFQQGGGGGGFQQGGGGGGFQQGGGGGSFQQPTY